MMRYTGLGKLKRNYLPFVFTYVWRVCKSFLVFLRRKTIKIFYSRPEIGKFFMPVNGFTTFKDLCEAKFVWPELPRNAKDNWYWKVHDSEICRRKKPFSWGLNTSFERAAFLLGVNRYQDGFDYRAPEIYLVHVKKCKIISNAFLVLSQDNHIIKDSIWRDFHLEKIRELYGWTLPPITRRVDRVAVLGALWGKSYYHWLIDVLPRLYILEKYEMEAEIPLLLPSDLAKWQREALDLLGISLDRIMEFDGGHWEIEHMLFPSFLVRTGNSRPLMVSWLRDRFLKRIKDQTEETIWTRLYVSRRDANKRRVINESELVYFLKKRGFAVICPAELSFAEQIRAFSRAEIIVGPHGAGLSNMVFARPGSIIIELFPPNYVNGCYWALAESCGHKYAFLIGEKVLHDSNDFEVSLDRLNLLLDKIGIK